MDLHNSLLLVSALLSTIMYFYIILKGKKGKLFYCYIWLIGSCLIWFYGYILEWSAFQCDNINAAWCFAVFEYIGIVQTAMAYFTFSLFLTGYKADYHWLYILIFGLINIIFYILLFTNPYHHLIYIAYTLEKIAYASLFYIYISIFILSLCISIGILAKYISEQKGYIKKQASFLLKIFIILLTISFSEVLLAVILNLSNMLFFFTTFGTSLSVIFFNYINLKYHFLNVTSIALGSLVGQMPEAVIVIDLQNNILSWNNAFKIFFDPKNLLVINSNISLIINYIIEKQLDSETPPGFLTNLLNDRIDMQEGELTLNHSSRTDFKVNVKPVLNKNKLIGRVITFTEITSYKRTVHTLNEKKKEIQNRNEQIDKLNHLLSQKNQKLQEQAKIAGELAAARERNRVTQEVHDILGQTLSLLLVSLEVGNRFYPANVKLASDKIKDAIRFSAKGLEELAGSLFNSAKQDNTEITLSGVLNKLANDFQAIGITINLAIKAPAENITPVYIDCIYKICRETTSNAIRHGQANKVDIIITGHKHLLKVILADDGNGCEKIMEGFGISSMKQRVTKLHGKIKFKSGNPRGFTTSVVLPYPPAGLDTEAEPQHAVF